MLLKALIKRGINDVTLVIEDKEDALKASGEVPAITVVNASPIKPEVLNELDLEKCDVFVSVSRREEISILAALYAKEHNVKKIYVKTTKEDTKPILEKMGMKEPDIDLDHPANPDFGDYSTSVALKLTRVLKKNPFLIAEEIVKSFLKNNNIKKVEVIKP